MTFIATSEDSHINSLCIASLHSSFPVESLAANSQGHVQFIQFSFHYHSDLLTGTSFSVHHSCRGEDWPSVVRGPLKASRLLFWVRSLLQVLVLGDRENSLLRWLIYSQQWFCLLDCVWVITPLNTAEAVTVRVSFPRLFQMCFIGCRTFLGPQIPRVSSHRLQLLHFVHQHFKLVHGDILWAL